MFLGENLSLPRQAALLAHFFIFPESPPCQGPRVQHSFGKL